MGWNRAIATLAAIMASNVALAGPAVLEGAVKAPLTLDAATLEALPATTLSVTFETSKGPETGTYTGVLLWDLVQKAGLADDAGKNPELRRVLMVTGTDGYAVAVAVGEFAPRFGAKQALLAYEGGDGKAGRDRLRLIVPGDLHGGRAVSDVAVIELR